MSRRLWAVVVLLALASAWFGSLDYRKLIKPDEGRYAEIAREMAVSGDWVTPRLNAIKYFEKPPLQYWATAAAFTAFGENEWTARLWTGLTGFAGILLALFTGRRLFGPNAGWLAAGVLASSLLWLMMGHMNTLDMGLAFFLELALCGFLLAQEPEATGPPWALVAWAALALAVLSKGIVALVLTGGTLVLYSLLNWDFSPWRRLAPLRGLLLFLAIAAPWFILVSLANPEFPRFFFIHEHFERFLTTTHRRTQPVWFFVPVLLAGALPWTGLALNALATAWQRRSAASFQPRRFLLLWCLVVFGFFSASGSKLPSYILPLFPALALLIGDSLPRHSRTVLLAHLGAVAILAAAALILVQRVAGMGSEDTPAAMMAAYARWLTAAAGIWLAGSVGALALAWRRQTLAAALVLAAGGFVGGSGVLLGHESLARSNSAHHIASLVRPLLRPDVPFYSFRTYEQTLPFYLQRTLTLVEYQDEMAFGLAQEPAKWVASLAEFQQRWHGAADAFAIMTPEDFLLLQREELPMLEIARDTRRVIVRKPQS